MMEESAIRQRAMSHFSSLRPDNPAYSWLVLFTVMMGTFMVILDGTIVNVAIPSIMASFGVTLSEVVWVSTAYLIALSVLLAVSGWMAEHFGAKRVYMLGLVIFTFSSYLCGIAWNLHSLVFFRIIQGIGGGILTPVGMSLFSAEFPPDKRTVPFGFYSIAVAAAISLGPSFGGYLIESINWSWIFFINIPVGIFTLLAALLIFKTSEGKEIHSFDLFGLLTLTLFVVALLVAISSGNAPWNSEGWSSKFTIISFILSAIGGVLFVVIELNSKDPIVDLSVFKDRNFTLGNLVLFIFSFTLFGSSFLLPLYLQNGLDYTKIRTGLVLLPIGLMQGIVGPISGLLTKKFGGQFLVITGIICLAISYQFNSRFTLYSEEDTMLWVFAFRGIACGLMFAPLVAVTLATIPEEKMVQASGLFSVQRQIGAALGVAVFETIFVRRQIFHAGTYGENVDVNSPAFAKVLSALETSAYSVYGSGVDAIIQAQVLITNNINLQIFVQAIDDNLLIAGIITIFSCIPLFFLKRGTPRFFH